MCLWRGRKSNYRSGHSIVKASPKWVGGYVPLRECDEVFPKTAGSKDCRSTARPRIAGPAWIRNLRLACPMVGNDSSVRRLEARLTLRRFSRGGRAWRWSRTGRGRNEVAITLMCGLRFPIALPNAFPQRFHLLLAAKNTSRTAALLRTSVSAAMTSSAILNASRKPAIYLVRSSAPCPVVGGSPFP